jgi:hypothetical protein
MIVHKCKRRCLVSSNSSTCTKIKIAAKRGGGGDQIFKPIDTSNQHQPKAIRIISGDAFASCRE